MKFKKLYYCEYCEKMSKDANVYQSMIDMVAQKETVCAKK